MKTDCQCPKCKNPANRILSEKRWYIQCCFCGLFTLARLIVSTKVAN